MNSVYGRFALKSDLTLVSQGEGLRNNMGSRKLNLPKKNINYIIPIFITAYSRVILSRLFEQIKNMGASPLYTDTDSCYFYFQKKIGLNNEINRIYNKLPITNKIGDLSLESYQSGGFFNAKSYRVDYFENEKFKYVQKGIPEANRPEYQQTGKTVYQRPQKLRPALRGVMDRDANVWYGHLMQKKTEYRKREKADEIATDLFKTKPIILTDF